MWLDAGAFRSYACGMKETRGHARWVLILSFWMLSCSTPAPAEELHDGAATSEGSEREQSSNPGSEPADDATVAEPSPGAEPSDEDEGGTPTEEVTAPAEVTSDADAGPSGGPAPSPPEPSSTQVAPPSSPPAGTVRTLDLADYRDRLTGMWIAECLANWTGLQREGAATSPGEFLTDEDWEAQGLQFVLQDPWMADDDTDIEFIYLMTMADLSRVKLTPEDIAAAWNRHTEPGIYIWVSNLAAQGLMRESPPVLPPSTSLLAVNDQSLMIDAQLTTEMFGAVAPGMPAYALEIADLPIRTTASGYSAHAAQFHVALYSLAAVVDHSLLPQQQILWLVDTARRLIPETSKTAAVIDLVLEDYLDNDDSDDWERTRDRVAQVFQTDDEANGYRYLEWYESSVNLAGGLIALLYGEGDLARTIQIGTLSGWDSDNGTATMGGLLGLLLGADGVSNAFPEQTLSTNYRIDSTRVGFDQPTYSFDHVVDRMATLVELAVRDAGGETSSDVLTLPPTALDTLSWSTDNPLAAIHETSANNQMAPDEVSVELEGEVDPGWPSAPIDAITDGLEFDYSGRDRRLDVRDISEYPSQEPAPRCVPLRSNDAAASVAVVFRSPVSLSGIRFVEGGLGEGGGFWQDPVVEIRMDGSWVDAPLSRPFDPEPAAPYQIHELTFQAPADADGVRIRERDVVAGFVSVCELDGILTR